MPYQPRSILTVFRPCYCSTTGSKNHLAHRGSPPERRKVFHEISRAEGPEQQTTENDGLSHLASARPIQCGSKRIDPGALFRSLGNRRAPRRVHTLDGFGWTDAPEAAKPPH